MTERLLKVLTLIASVVHTWTAQLDCDNGCKVAGTKYNLTCTSVSSGNCQWYEGSTLVVACAADGNCDSQEIGYDGFRISNSHYVLQIESLTTATIECRLGSDRQTCSVTPVTDIPTGTLNATCESNLIKCAGITNHGTPAVAIELREGSTVLTSTTTGGSVNITHVPSAGVTYTCAVTGNLTNCLSTTSVDVTCPAVPTPVTSTTTQQTQQTQSPHPTDIPGPGEPCYIIILVVTLILLSGSVVSLLVIYFVKKEWFQYAAIGFGGCNVVVGIICTAVYFAVCQSDTPEGTSAAAFSIILLIVGVIFIVIGVLYPYCSKMSSKPV